MSVVLMYHDIFPDNDTSTVDAEDLPYALSVSDFTRQLDVLAERPVGLYNDGSFPEIVITFDDGHISNLKLAAPLLQERNLSAYFFITTGFIDSRQHFMSSSELAELSNLPGMCIGSHGVTHHFFDDMSADESINELKNSRTFLENVSQSACTSISFPGGRYSKDTLGQLKGAGYTQWFGSEIGTVKAEQLHSANSNTAPQQRRLSEENHYENRWKLVSQCENTPLERVAIRQNTQIDEFHRIINADKSYFQKKRLNSQAKHFARRLIGNRLYHGLYKSLSAR